MVDDTARAFDRAEWHAEAAGAGQPFAHAQLYRTWLERRDLASGAAGSPDELHAETMTDEGRRFTEAYYGRYLDDYAAVFADRPAYGVTPDEDAFERIARVIDQRYAEWVYAGRPELPPETEPLEQLASMLDRSVPPPELTEAAVLGMSPDQVIETLERMLRQRRSGG